MKQAIQIDEVLVILSVGHWLKPNMDKMWQILEYWHYIRGWNPFDKHHYTQLWSLRIRQFSYHIEVGLKIHNTGTNNGRTVTRLKSSHLCLRLLEDAWLLHEVLSVWMHWILQTLNPPNPQLLLLISPHQFHALLAILHLVVGHPVIHNDVSLNRVLFVVTVARVCLRQKTYLPHQQQQQQQHDND